MIDPALISLAEFLTIVIVGYFAFKQVNESYRTHVKTVGSSQKYAGYRGHSINELLDNLPTILSDQRKMKLKMQAEGATEQALKPMTDRIHQLELLQQWEIPVRIFSPLVDRVPFLVMRLVKGAIS